MASIYKRGRIFWVIYYQCGRKIQKSLKTTDKTIAKFKKNEIENRLSAGDLALSNQKVLAEDALKFYAEDSKHRKGARTIKEDENRLKAFFKWSGIAWLGQITEEDLSRYMKARLDNNEINKTTANHTIKTVKAFVNFAIRMGFMASDPLKTARRFKIERTPPPCLSKREIKAILKACRGTRIYPMVMTAVYTGMRYGELQNLKWEDINLANNTLIVQRSKAGNFRVIPIHRDLRPVMKPENLPFPQIRGYNAIRLLRRITGSPDIGWHDFRHSFASHLVMNGVDIVTVGKLLGHSKIETTMVYSHMSNEHVNRSIAKLVI